MSDILGRLLMSNMRMGVPTRTKSAGDYVGYPMSACGDFAISSSSRPSMRSPWLSSARDSSTAPYSLHDEITQFMLYMEPTAQEKRIRQDLVKRFTNLIASFRMDATVRPVGSYVTGLYLPTSDIDMVLTFGNNSSIFAKLELFQILYKIERSGFASRVQDVLRASVPLIRITDKITGIEIDLTAADTHGIEATKAVQKWMKADAAIIKMLVTVVKMFLSIRRCGTTYTGGINSYVLVWMVVAWVNLEWKKPQNDVAVDISTLNSAFDALSVQRYPATPIRTTTTSTMTTSSPKKETTPTVDYGRILSKFFDFYGNKFDYQGRAIRIEPRPSYQTKTQSYRDVYSRYNLRSRYTDNQHYLLSIFDPAGSTIDMGAKAYGIKHVQASFREAHQILDDRKKLANGPSAARQRSHSSILGEILGGDFTVFEKKRKGLGDSRSQ